MKYYFGYKKNQKKLKKILDEWLNTPFRHHCGVKQQGTDCIFFVARVLEELGILKWKKNLIPDYPPDWHMHNTQQLLTESILKELNVKEVGFDNPINGDIITYFFGKAASHASIFYDDHIYQAVNDIGVIKVHYLDKDWNKKKKFNFRIKV
jgi:hypothetical protein